MLRSSIQASLLTSTLFVSTLAPPVSACTCRSVSVEEAFARADAVVEASVISLSDGTDRSFYGRRADLEVKRAWKGGDAKDLSVYTGLSTEDCAYGFRKGVLYVVFAYKDEEGLLRTSSCSRTKPHGAAIEELKFLEKLESRSPRPLGGAAANHSLQPTRLLRRGSLRSVKLVGRAAELRIR